MVPQTFLKVNPKIYLVKLTDTEYRSFVQIPQTTTALYDPIQKEGWDQDRKVGWSTTCPKYHVMW